MIVLAIGDSVTSYEFRAAIHIDMNSSDEDHRSKKSKKEKKEKKSREKKEKKEKKSKKEKDSRREDWHISASDYFNRHNEYRLWLHLSKQITFDSKTSAQHRELFDEFVDVFNSGKLSKQFYDKDGLDLDMISSLKTTNHKWSFNMNEEERLHLSDTAHHVHSTTANKRKDAEMIWKQPSNEKDKNSTHHGSSGNRHSGGGGNRGRGDGLVSIQSNNDHEESNADRDRMRGYMQQRKEDLASYKYDAGTHEARRDKKRGLAQSMQQSARNNEEGRFEGGDALPDRDLYGGDDATLKADQFKRRKRQEKEDKKQERIKELSEKFNDNDQSWMSKLGIDLNQGGKISIAPRKDM